MCLVPTLLWQLVVKESLEHHQSLDGPLLGDHMPCQSANTHTQHTKPNELFNTNPSFSDC